MEKGFVMYTYIFLNVRNKTVEYLYLSIWECEFMKVGNFTFGCCPKA